MGTFAVAASEATVERGKKLLAQFLREGEKSEDALIRIFDYLEHERTRASHPELAPKYEEITKTINALFAQIDGVVTGQDFIVDRLKQQLDDALVEKRTAMEDAQKKIAEAATQMADVKRSADDAITQATAVKTAAQQETAAAVARADAAERAAAAAQEIAAAKTDSNDLLLHQMAAVEADLKAYRKLQTDFAEATKKIDKLEQEHKIAELNHSAELKEIKAKHTQELAQCDLNHSNALWKLESELRAEYDAKIASEREKHDKLLADVNAENTILRTKIIELATANKSEAQAQKKAKADQTDLEQLSLDV